MANYRALCRYLEILHNVHALSLTMARGQATDILIEAEQIKVSNNLSERHKCHPLGVCMQCCLHL